MHISQQLVLFRRLWYIYKKRKGETQVKRRSTVQNMIFISLFATLMCIGAWLHFPAAVPATMQTFVVFVALGLIGSCNTFIMLLIYVLLGALGLPVFSGFTGGIGALTGPTAGFIWGFLLGVPVFYIFEKYLSGKKSLIIIAYIIYILLHYIPGALWYCYFNLGRISAEGILSSALVTVVPFIVPDVVKLGAALLVVGKVKKIRN